MKFNQKASKAFKYLNQSVIGVLLSMGFTAHAHGGISALDGLLELMIMFAVLSAIGLTWVVFVAVMIFAHEVSLRTIDIFRKTTYGLTAVLILMVILISFNEGFSAGFLQLATLVLLGVFIFTELSIVATKKLRNQNW